MSNVQIRGLMKVHKKNRRAAAEQERELRHLRHRAYRGVETVAELMVVSLSMAPSPTVEGPIPSKKKSLKNF